MKLLQLTIDTLESHIEIDFHNYKEHINPLLSQDNIDIIKNGLTFAFYGLSEILIRQVNVSFEVASHIHHIYRSYQKGHCFMKLDAIYQDKQAQEQVDQIIQINVKQFLFQHFMPVSFMTRWIQNPQMNPFSPSQISADRISSLQDQMKTLSDFLIDYNDYQVMQTYFKKNHPYLSLYRKHLQESEAVLENKRKNILRDSELIRQLDEMEQEMQQKQGRLQIIDERREALNELSSLYDEYLISQDHLFDLEEIHRQAIASYTNENEDYIRLYHQYINQKAGILAKELKENKPCPVCGSIHHPAPCQIEGKEVSLEILFKEEKKLEKATENLKKKGLEKTRYLQHHQNLIQKIVQKKEQLHITEDISKELFIKEFNALHTNLLTQNNKKLNDEITYLHKLKTNLPSLKKDYEELKRATEQINEEYEDLKIKLKRAEIYCEKIKKDYRNIDLMNQNDIDKKIKELNSICKTLIDQGFPLILKTDRNDFMEKFIQRTNQSIHDDFHQEYHILYENQTFLIKQNDDLKPLESCSSTIRYLCIGILSFNFSMMLSGEDFLFLETSSLDSYYPSFLYSLSEKDAFQKIYIDNSSSAKD